MQHIAHPDYVKSGATNEKTMQPSEEYHMTLTGVPIRQIHQFASKKKVEVFQLTSIDLEDIIKHVGRRTKCSL